MWKHVCTVDYNEPLPSWAAKDLGLPQNPWHPKWKDLNSLVRVRLPTKTEAPARVYRARRATFAATAVWEAGKFR